MKRLALVAVLLVSLAGCSYQPSSSTTGTVGGGDIETVEHDGHLFTVWDGVYAGGIIHSPSCPCQNTPEAPE